MSLDPKSLFYPAVQGVQGNVKLSAGSRGAATVYDAKNCKIEGGAWRTRDRWETLDVEGDDYQAHKFQNVIDYRPVGGAGIHYFGTGVDRMIEAAGGRLFELTLDAQGRKLVSSIIPGPVYGKDFDIAWLAKGENYVLRTDGESPTAIWDGQNRIYPSPGYTSAFKEASRVPNRAGPIAYSNKRFLVTLEGRQVYFGDGLHEQVRDSPIDILRFTDQVYDDTSIFFGAQSDSGNIIGAGSLINSSKLTTTGETGSMYFTDGGHVFFIPSNRPRTEWANQQMVFTLSTEGAPTGPYAFFIRDGDMLFRGSGGIQSLRLSNVTTEKTGSPMINLSKPMEHHFRNDHEPWLYYATMANPQGWDNLLASVSPRVNGPYRWHMGWASANWNSDDSITATSFSWEGIHDVHESMGKLVKFHEHNQERNRRLLAFMIDPETGEKLVIMNQEDEGPDIGPGGEEIPIHCALATKLLSNGSEYRLKNFPRLFIRFFDIDSDIVFHVTIKTIDRCFKYDPARIRLQTEELEEGVCIPQFGGERIFEIAFEEIEAKSQWIQVELHWRGVTSVDLAQQMEDPEGSLPDKLEPCDTEGDLNTGSSTMLDVFDWDEFEAEDCTEYDTLYPRDV